MAAEPISVEELSERYKRLYTPAIADILDERGLCHQILPADIQAIAPGMRLAGPAQTIKGAPVTIHKDEYLEVAIRAFLEGQPGMIAVFDTSEDRRAAHWGELVTTATRLRGCAGAVIDGGVRDVERIIETGFPVFARFRSPADIRGRWRYVDAGIPIQIGEVLIQPGDFIVGDANGVVVVPGELALDVLVEAEKVVEVENQIREELRAGANPLDLYKKYGRF
jgi:4-hydroxy-4-methyl-2-oxoglutarate aldolase